MEGIKLPKPETPIRFYTEGLAARLEELLISKKVKQIGSMKYREKYILKKPLFEGVCDIRSAGLDMTDNQRAYRTVDIKKLTRDELGTVQRHEQKRLTRFLIGPTEIRYIVNNHEIPDQISIDDKTLERIVLFNIRNRPPLTRKYDGLSIPPYFEYDLEFDGMDYHHAWDLLVWSADMGLRVQTRPDSETVEKYTRKGK